MRPTARGMQTRATGLQRIPSALVEWASIILILLAVVVCTFSGDLQLISRANPSRQTPSVSTPGCERFRPHRDDACEKHGFHTCVTFSTSDGSCVDKESYTNVGGCLDWDDEDTGACDEWVVTDATPPNCSDGETDLDFPSVCVTDTLNGFQQGPPPSNSSSSSQSSLSSNPSSSSSSSGIASSCPDGFTPITSGSNQGECQDNTVAGPNGVIGATCQGGYAYDSATKNCMPNPVAQLTETTSGVCTSSLSSSSSSSSSSQPSSASSSSSSSSSGSNSYTCPYGQNTLVCTFSSSSSSSSSPSSSASSSSSSSLLTLAGPLEHCVLNPGPKETYDCSYDNNYNPTACVYSGSITRSPSGISTCTAGDCTIYGCFVASGGTSGMYANDFTAECPSPIPTTMIGVTIDQQCAPLVADLNNQNLSCTYGNNLTTKTEQIVISCTNTQSCTTTDPYGVKLTRHCTPPDPQGNYSCYFQDQGQGSNLWIEYCQVPSTATGGLPHCEVDNGSSIKLGILNCTSSGGSRTCTIQDLSSHTTTITCYSLTYCTSKTPDCPHSGTYPPTATTETVGESSLVCNGSLVINLLEGMVSSGGLNSTVTLVYPLSEAELEFLLDPTQIGVGGQSWTRQEPRVNYL